MIRALKYFVLNLYTIMVCRQILATDQHTPHVYVDDGVGKSVSVELNRHDEHDFERQILALFGLRRIPRSAETAANLNHSSAHENNMSASTAVELASEFMMNLYANEMGNDDDLATNRYKKLPQNMASVNMNDSLINSADTIMSLTVQSVSENTWHFDVSDIQNSPHTLQLIYAELRIISKEAFSSMNMTIYDSKNRLIVKSANVSGTLNITNVVQSWIADELPAQLNIEVHDSQNDEIAMNGFVVAYFMLHGLAENIHKVDDDNHLPIERTSTSRTKRAAPSSTDSWYSIRSDHDTNGANDACKKRTMYVSFRDLGWEKWVIAPDGYAADYCGGKCAFPLTAHMNGTNHAIVQAIIYFLDPFRVPEPLCAPTELTSMTVLYFDAAANVVLKKYNNMVVQSCGCQ